jgi:hypothetical protein
MKHYFFKDIDTVENSNDIPYQATGIVDLVNCELDKPNYSGKDLAVIYLDPFDGYIVRAWRMVGEVELFEVSDFDHGELLKHYERIEDSQGASLS